MSSLDRARIAKLSRAAHGGILSVDDAARALEVSAHAAAITLAGLARRGWLTRARRGLYLVRPLEAEPTQAAAPEDPWILAREAFAPCYVGGWSAAEHWGLTSQLFRSTLVVTAASGRSRDVTILGQRFRLFRVPRPRIEGRGIVAVRRGAERVPVSTPERTLVDGLRRPELCGGIRNVADLLREYSLHDAHVEALLAEAAAAGSGAAWKRLGYLAERVWPNAAVADAAARHATAGNVALDPAVRRRGTLLCRWRLWVNVPIEAGPSGG
ncbi:MAG TPA: type IV toxin-antitoxin system AbiEi family antitoxin [Acidobacteriota bacterium]|nr:type IV toxin-antitoxin system AbiEi family antitoxin [Acidobacteriota bacterium]